MWQGQICHSEAPGRSTGIDRDCSQHRGPAMAHHGVLRMLLGVLVFAGCAEESPWLFPEVAASSRYVDYGAWADVSDVCMDDKLDAWDAYIEEVAAYLEVDPPQEKIRYSWVPEAAQNATTWTCAVGGNGCAYYAREGYHALVFARELEVLHEFVHAVDVPGLGRSHPVFIEGMAEYLSESGPTDVALRDFAVELERTVRQGELTSRNYRRAMHFVGSLIERGGFDRYLEFRALVGTHGEWPDFVSAYQEVYGEELSAALVAMESTPVQGRWQPWGCGSEDSGPAWSTPETLEVALRGECGDGGLFGGGLADGEPRFAKFFTLDIVHAGFYDVTLRGADGTTEDIAVQISSCPSARYSEHVLSSEPSVIMIWEGRHQVRVDYPSAAAARSGVILRLENLNPVGP